jgi:uncharacterized protein (TIGR00297 family)
MGTAAVATGSFSESLRKSVHILMVGFAFLLRYLTWPQAAALATLALLHNWLLLPRYGRARLYRSADQHRGYPVGILLYPLSILLLILLFRGRLEIVAAAWGLLAFGDGCATLIGTRFGGRKLPWNPDKSWAGSAAYLVAGAAGASLLIWWTRYAGGREPWDPAAIVLHPLLTAVLAAALESLPSLIDDNLSVPLLAAGFLYCLGLLDPALLWGDGQPLAANLLMGLGINLILSAAALLAGSVSWTGIAVGTTVYTVLYAFLGPAGFAVGVAFFVLATLATKLGLATKQARGIAQELGGARGAKHVVANCSLAAFFAVLAAGTSHQQLFALGAVAALATAAADTCSSEIGKFLGQRTYLVTNFRRVPPGTEGAVSLEGTLAGLGAAAALAALAWSLGLLELRAAGLVLPAALIGTSFESYLGAALGSRHAYDNDVMNFLNTLAGGGTAIAAAAWLALA